jgi:hypothetical protein
MLEIRIYHAKIYVADQELCCRPLVWAEDLNKLQG